MRLDVIDVARKLRNADEIWERKQLGEANYFLRRR
jgi:hypothetical protein